MKRLLDNRPSVLLGHNLSIQSLLLFSMGYNGRPCLYYARGCRDQSQPQDQECQPECPELLGIASVSP